MAKEPLFRPYQGSSIHLNTLGTSFQPRFTVIGWWVVTLQQEVKKVNWKDQLCLAVHHDDFKNDDDFQKHTN